MATIPTRQPPSCLAQGLEDYCYHCRSLMYWTNVTMQLRLYPDVKLKPPILHAANFSKDPPLMLKCLSHLFRIRGHSQRHGMLQWCLLNVSVANTTPSGKKSSQKHLVLLTLRLCRTVHGLEKAEKIQPITFEIKGKRLFHTGDDSILYSSAEFEKSFLLHILYKKEGKHQTKG